MNLIPWVLLNHQQAVPVKSQRHILGYLNNVSRRVKKRQCAAWPKSMRVMSHQRDGLALFLDASPSHQLSQGLSGASHGYLFNSAGRQ